MPRTENPIENSIKRPRISVLHSSARLSLLVGFRSVSLKICDTVEISVFRWTSSARRLLTFSIRQVLHDYTAY